MPRRHKKLLPRRLLRRVRRDAALFGMLEEAWRSAVLPEYASITRVVSWKRRVLTVGVACAPALSELASFQMADLLRRLNEEFLRRGIAPARELRFVLEERLA